MTTINTSLSFQDLVWAVAHRKQLHPDREEADDLVGRLRRILSIAQTAAPEPWIQESADLIVAALLTLQTFERDNVDPRRRVSLATAAQMATTVKAMRQAGHSRGDAVAALRQRHGLGRSQVYALLKMSDDITGRKTG